MEGCFTFQLGEGGCFSDGGGFIFKWGVWPMVGHRFSWGGEGAFKTNRRMGG